APRARRRGLPLRSALRLAGRVGRLHEHVGRRGVERRRRLLEQPELEEAAPIAGLPHDTDDLRHPLRAVDQLPGIRGLLLTRLPARTGGTVHAQEAGWRRVRPFAEHRSLPPVAATPRWGLSMRTRRPRGGPHTGPRPHAAYAPAVNLIGSARSLQGWTGRRGQRGGLRRGFSPPCPPPPASLPPRSPAGNRPRPPCPGCRGG